MSDARKRVVVTGVGTINPIAHNAPEFWNSLMNGVSNFRPSGLPGVPFVATVPDNGWNSGFSRRMTRYTDRCTQLALQAAGEALNNADILDDSTVKETAGVFVGTSIGGIGTLSDEFSDAAVEGITSITPIATLKSLPNMITANINIEFGMMGESLTFTSACSSGTVAIGEAYRRIRSGDLQVALAGGTEASVIDYVLESFRKLGAMTENEDVRRASVPFSRHRSGFVMSEASGMVVLENLEHARRRGAVIIGEIVGYHGATDGKSLLVPDPAGIRRMIDGLFTHGFEPEQVGYINAHGTSTKINDKMEADVFSDLFTHRPLVSSTKSYYGHPLGAAGALEAIVCLMTLREGVAIPTLNVSEEDVDRDEIDLNLILDDPVTFKGELIMSTSCAFGGHNAALLFCGLD